MKKVLLMVVSADSAPYAEMTQTSLRTWDSVEVEGTETIFYCGKSKKPDTDKVKYFDLEDDFHLMIYKDVVAFDWALQNKEWDVMVRTNSSMYVNKKALKKYIDTLPDSIFHGKLNESVYNINYLWGGCLIITRDLVQKLVDNKDLINYKLPEDVAISDVMQRIGVPMVENMQLVVIEVPVNGVYTLLIIENGKHEVSYFSDFNDLKHLTNSFCFRCKQEGFRKTGDKYVMEQLFKIQTINTKEKMGINYDSFKRELIDGGSGELSVGVMNGWEQRPKMITMIGYKRLSNLEYCISEIIKNNIDGDVIETGVWQGGACVFMRKVLNDYNSNKIVYVADSFEGLPKPDPKYIHDKGDTHHTVPMLSVSLEQVQNNFIKYGLLENTVFLKGWFKYTLPTLKNKFSIIRLDGDMFESTNDALESLYPLLSVGGFCIIDDYALVSCVKAVEMFRKKYKITDEIIKIDYSGIYWKKQNDSTRKSG